MNATQIAAFRKADAAARRARRTSDVIGSVHHDRHCDIEYGWCTCDRADDIDDTDD